MEPKHLLLILMAIFLFLPERFYAQTASAHVPGGYQRVFICGYVNDHHGDPVADAEITVSFNGFPLKVACTNQKGFYGMPLENYGGIQHVQATVRRDGYKSEEIKNINLLAQKIEADFFMLKLDNSVVIVRESLVTRCFGRLSPDYSGYSMSDGYRFVMPIKYVNKTYDESLNKLAFRAVVTDKAKTPIPQAKVELRFANNATRHGTADNQGNITLFCELSGFAAKGRVKVSAPGYHTRFIRSYHFLDPNYIYPFRLRKKKIREAYALAETPTEQTQPIADKKVLTATDKPLDIILYPNPAKDQLQVQTAGATIQKLEILDLTGKKVLQREHIDSHTVRIPVDELKNGVYFVTLQCDGQTVTKVLHVVR